MKKKIHSIIEIASTKGQFSNIRPDFSNVKEVYQNNLLKWFIHESDYKGTKNGEGIKIHNNIIEHPENIVVSKTMKGFELSESDFINAELKCLERLILNELSFIESKKFESYKNYLINLEPQQKESIKADKLKKNLHNDFFKDNAFEIWQSMFDKFKITERSYSIDIDFMFRVMKYNKLIHDNIGLTDIKNWINDVHEISFEKIRHTDHKSQSNEKRLTIYNDIVSK
jgi:hypothetical protein